MRNRMYGGVRGRKTKVGGKPTFVFLLLDFRFPKLRPFQTYAQGIRPANQGGKSRQCL